MDEIIKNFPKQFEFEPEIINKDNLKVKDNYIVCGMGGSHLSADILKRAYPGLSLNIHSDYDLPEMSDERLRKNLIIISSYSGNTEEAVSSLLSAINKKLDCAVIASGGKLLTLAKENNIPYIKLPEENIPPRMSLGYSLMALLKFVGNGDKLSEANNLAVSLNSKNLKNEGKELARTLENKIPLIYSSSQNYPIAYIYKITFNESVKIPAFCNIFPELNHNEMEGFDFDSNGASRDLSDNFHLVFLKDKSDHPRIIKRMEATEKILGNIGATTLNLESGPALHKIFSAVIVGYWASFYLSEFYGIEPVPVPLIEKFKNIIE